MPFPTTPECTGAAERALGVQLRNAWRDRLLRANGGELELDDEGWQLFPVQDTSDRKRAGRTANHFVQENVRASSWRGFPPDAVAIGEDGSGNYLVLLRAPSQPELGEQVFRWGSRDLRTGQGGVLRQPRVETARRPG